MDLEDLTERERMMLMGFCRQRAVRVIARPHGGGSQLLGAKAAADYRRWSDIADMFDDQAGKD